MKEIFRPVLIFALALVGCTQTPVARNGNSDPARTRRMITGSNIPQPVNRVTASPTSATIPLESQARDRPGLTPTEPVVGAGGQSLYRLNEPSTGAGPAGSNPMPSSN